MIGNTLLDILSDRRDILRVVFRPTVLTAVPEIRQRVAGLLTPVAKPPPLDKDKF